MVVSFTKNSHNKEYANKIYFYFSNVLNLWRKIENK